MFFYRVADVFPMDLQSECLQLIRLLDNLADLVRKFLGTFSQKSFTHFNLQSNDLNGFER